MTKLSLKIKVDRLLRLDNGAPLRAFADITVNGVFEVRRLAVLMGREGLFVSMPKSQNDDFKWYDIVRPLTPEARQIIEDAVLEAYGGE